MKWIRVAGTNLVVLLGLLVCAEVGLRVVSVWRTCDGGSCDFTRISSLKIEDFGERFETRFFGITQFDPDLGYAPTPGFDAIIDAQDWPGVRVTVGQDQLRRNDNEIPLRRGSILAVGDSFTFGDQVANGDTWPACLERELGRPVHNAGVFGYGAAQALKRANIKTAQNDYDVVVLSVLVGEDLRRDQMNYRVGFPRPAVIGTDDGLRWAEVPDRFRPGTRYAPTGRRTVLVWWYEHSIIFSTLQTRLLKLPNLTGDRLQTRHPQAASIPEILDFVLMGLSNLDVPKKVLMLQYQEDIGNERKLEEREMILDRAADYPGLAVVDTYGALEPLDKDEIWNQHHTVRGNEVVCQELARSVAIE